METLLSKSWLDPERSLYGKVALVTGSTSGIGLGIAHALARCGASIMLNGLGRAEDIARTQQAIAQEARVTVLYSDADLTRVDAVGEMVEMTCDTLGGIDILVNNAGIQHVAPVDEFPPAKWDQIVALNLSAAFHPIRLVLPRMKQNGFGRIVNIASAHGLVASPFKAAYVTAKQRAARPDQDRRAGSRGAAGHLQRSLPGLRRHAAGREADRRSGQGSRHPARIRHP
ncbi:MAG TPA: SDR family NAD(P)-dependent oxidoreductase [Acetobacteraceae bacterium]|nr:SDR family NAD(P)-dependent oxidoreductase [Acetobacteraceae bacterium]